MTIGVAEMKEYCDESAYHALGLTHEDILMLSTLARGDNAMAHNDPFDRILICQAKSNGMIFLTHDHLIPYYEEACIKYV